jgi:benzoyl-CoA reductase subunit BamC
LIYEEREEEVDDNGRPEDLDIGVEALLNKYGYDKLSDAVARKGIGQ